MGAEQRVELLQLRGVREILHVHAQTLRHIEVLLLQLLFTGFHAIDEGLLLLRELQGASLLVDSVVVIAPRLVLLCLKAVKTGCLGKLVKQRVIPCCGLVDTSQVSILDGESLTGGRGFAEHLDIAQRKGTYVHVVVDAVEKTLNIDVRHGYRYCTLFLAAGRHHGDQTDD